MVSDITAGDRKTADRFYNIEILNIVMYTVSLQHCKLPKKDFLFKREMLRKSDEEETAAREKRKAENNITRNHPKEFLEFLNCTV